tara:strand:- start:932 stop:1327 length:396 start_codon:yes stop_codon:yes gene_type:complete
MELINDFVERFHNNTLPSPEKCFLLEDGDEIFIKKWIVNGKLNIKVKDLFLWIEKKYFKDKSNLEDKDKIKFEEINQRFFMDNWRMILLLSEYQNKYRYYSKAIDSIKNKSYPEMNTNQFLKLFEKDDRRI